ncbi:hypothetical protein BDF20DRAFT_827849 [Mycotypha africana]|uniref:uncharacterized protein n=1 Tax=Mycotypha africana TaxID=64632 RepID=UPI0023012AE0|nr:uncharacterized protein BDF20DRAFT_827849 [Mycotypha africana]KAI8968370.1 hypothetical protein BDF20DRAFT_827849 [Mycotypha africana]
MTNNTEAQPFLERCSICFDSKLDFCLEKCRDQFCLDCFRKYVNEVVKSSWGLSVTVIKCPVCRATIPPGEWKKYLSESTIEIYNRFNRPFRSFSKHCPSCEMEVIPCNSSSTDKKRVYVKGYTKNIIKFYEKYPSEERQGHNQFVQIFNNLEFRNSTLFEIHHQLLKSLLDLCRNNKESERSVKDISLQILQLEMQPETWRRLQFDHISFFPNIECLNCQTEFCLQCGDKAHGNLSCEEYMEELLRLKGKDSTYLDNDDVKTIEWKLKYSRRCPSCSMMINRDEGCNKIDCTFCGFSFCWQCRSLWSKTELGLPNLDLIYAKLNAGKED